MLLFLIATFELWINYYNYSLTLYTLYEICSIQYIFQQEKKVQIWNCYFSEGSESLTENSHKPYAEASLVIMTN